MDFLTHLDSHSMHLVALAAVALFCVMALWMALIPQARLKRARAEISRLRHELDTRGQMLEKCRDVSRDLAAAQPQAVVQAVKDARKGGDVRMADAAFTRWVLNHGASVAQLLMYQAEWAYARARGSIRPVALVASESYAMAARTLDPANTTFSGFLRELQTVRQKERGVAPDVSAALSQLRAAQSPDAPEPDLFDADPAVAAADAERDAEAQYAAGRNYLALTAITRALELRRGTLRENPDLVLNDQALEGYVLLGLGRESEALGLLFAVADTMRSDPLYGPDHPDTLACRFELARILADIDRGDEALSMISDVLERQLSSPDLGPDHPDTQESQKFMNQLRRQTAV